MPTDSDAINNLIHNADIFYNSGQENWVILLVKNVKMSKNHEAGSGG